MVQQHIVALCESDVCSLLVIIDKLMSDSRLKMRSFSHDVPRSLFPCSLSLSTGCKHHLKNQYCIKAHILFEAFICSPGIPTVTW